MAANNYSNNVTNENQGYTYNGAPGFYSKCTDEQQSSSSYPTVSSIYILSLTLFSDNFFIVYIFI